MVSRVSFEVNDRSSDYVFQDLQRHLLTRTSQHRCCMAEEIKSSNGRSRQRWCNTSKWQDHYQLLSKTPSHNRSNPRGVDIYDIALNCGTSINYIEKTYSHVTVQMRSKDITKGLGVHRLYDPIKNRKCILKLVLF